MAASARREAATTTSRERATASAAETEALAERFARLLRPGDLVVLAGPMGAGKTTFVRGLARGAGSTADVMSPTFQLVRVYPGRIQLAHADLFRLESPRDFAELGFDELLDEGALVVEWGTPLEREAAATVRFFLGRDDERRLVLESEDERWTW